MADPTTIWMIWRRDTPQETALDAITAGARHYKDKFGRLPNRLSVPPGFLTEAETAQLRERWTVESNVTEYFKNDIWLSFIAQPAKGASS